MVYFLYTEGAGWTQYETLAELCEARDEANGGPPDPPDAEALTSLIEDQEQLESKVQGFFEQYAGDDQVLQLQETAYLIHALGASLGADIEKNIGRDVAWLFKRFDVSSDGGLGCAEVALMVAAVLDHLRQAAVNPDQGDSPYETGGPAQVKNAVGGWTDCTVEDIREDGAIRVDIFPDYYWCPALVKIYLRPVADNSLPPTIVTDGEVPDEEETEDSTGGTVRAIVMWNTFTWLADPRWHIPSTRLGADAVKNLLIESGVEEANITEIAEQNCSPEIVRNTIYQVGQSCDESDTFIFFYTGHGAQLRDTTRDEGDGLDECICTVRGSRADATTYLRDDDFSSYISTYVKAQRIICMLDCCHSGTICDLGKNQWRNKCVVAISGCMDQQEATGLQDGGVLSLSLRDAGKALAGQENVSAAKFFSQVYQCVEELKLASQFPIAQIIQMHCPSHVQPSTFRWPLISAA